MNKEIDENILDESSDVGAVENLQISTSDAPENHEGEFVFDGESEPSFELIPEENTDIGETEAEEASETETEIDDKDAGQYYEDDGGEGFPAPVLQADRKKTVREIGARRLDKAFDFIELFIFTLAAVLLITSFAFRHSLVSGNSMQNTLQNGDRLIISDLFYEPKYGDIVVVEDREADMTKPIVKRVIATEGQRVRVTRYGIVVDGVLLEEDYVFTDGVSYSYSLDPFAFRDNETLIELPGLYYEFEVPEGEIFVLGDHRNDSRDSRFYGTVREDAILGRAILKFYPFESFEIYIFED